MLAPVANPIHCRAVTAVIAVVVGVIIGTERP